MADYNPKEIEAKWQKKWLEEKVFAAHDTPAPGAAPKPKYYQLETFPYPSGAGLHVGHPKGYIAEDIHARYMRMGGAAGKPREVLYTMGWDAFGLPTENYALKVGKTPREVTRENTDNFRRQVRMFGLSYDWDREINTSEPDYYKWTQWLFIQLFKRGLAYRANAKVNWCPKDQTVLANEQVVGGKCERCGSEIEERDMEQWFVKITKYADRLLEGLKGLDWPEATMKRQQDWIGKSIGTEIDFPLDLDYRYVLLHGFEGSPEENFFPWLKRELTRRELSFVAPQLPNTDHPTEEEQVNYVLKNIQFDECTVLFGHSLGAVVAMKVLEKLPHSIAGVVFAAGFLDADRAAGPRPYKDNFTWNFDFEKIRANVGFVRILSDLNDTAVPPEQGRLIHEKLDGRLIETVARKPHFDNDEEPDILQTLLPLVTVFTTRPDTIFGATYLAIAPEHNAIRAMWSKILNRKDVEAYLETASHKTERMRKEEAREKTGVEIKGVQAINPANGQKIPIWIADHVLLGYGTGAIMAVPAHDPRDLDFAKKFNLPIKQVVKKDVPRARSYLMGASNISDEDLTVLGVTIAGKENNNRKIEIPFEKLQAYEALVSQKMDIGFWNEYVGNETVFLFKFPDGNVERMVLSDATHARINELAQQFAQTVFMSPWQMLANNSWYTDLVVHQESGTLINSGKFTGMDAATAQWEISQFVGGRGREHYRLRDWSVSRQRYWGVPIPMIHCEACRVSGAAPSGIVPVPDADLPVLLPDLADFRPQGAAPLASSPEFMDVKCPQCGAPAKRDPETLDTFVDSSWYYLAYAMKPISNFQFPISQYKEALAHWLPVDLYVIGAEHTVLHLLYARFMTKFLHDEGVLAFDEPFLKLRHQGLIRGADGAKMSKSKGNVVNPDEIVGEFGADTVRVYEMFMGPFEDGAPWDPKGIIGVERFLRRMWKYVDGGHGDKDIQGQGTGDVGDGKSARVLLHKTIKKVGEDIEAFKFNTAISSLMILLNELEKAPLLPADDIKNLLKILHPFAPHMAQELWSQTGSAGATGATYLDFEPWPQYDPALVADEKVKLVLQVNSRMRDTTEVAATITEDEAKALALANEKIKKILNGAAPKKIVYVDKKLVNVVI